MNEKQENNEHKLDDIDNAILQIKALNPEYNRNQIGNELVKLGIIKCRDTVYEHLQKNLSLQRTYEDIEIAIRDDHAKVIFPLARDRVHNTLNDNEISTLDIMPLIKLVYDKQMSSKQDIGSTVNTQINIESLQMMINQAKPEEY